MLAPFKLYCLQRVSRPAATSFRALALALARTYYTSQMSLPYANKVFRSSSNTPNGEVSQSTTFHYNQSPEDPHIVWAEYSGGAIIRGFLIATISDDQSLDARYQHVNVDGELRTGICRSAPEVLEDGRLRLLEKWRWTSGDGTSGESVVEEVRAEDEPKV